MEIRHIGIVFAICRRKGAVLSNNLREDLGLKRYEGLGIHERFTDEKPYRICKKCLSVIKKREENE